MGSTETYGLDGPTMTTSHALMASMAPRLGAPTHEPLLKGERPLLGCLDHRAHGHVAHRQDGVLDPQRPAQPRGDRGERLAGPQPLAAEEVRRQIAIPEPEPVRPPVAFDHGEAGERLFGKAPASLFVRQPRERVHHRVEVGRHVHPQVDEVVARVDDGRQRAGRKSAREPVEEARSPDATGESNHVHA
jgi:hypothetical protein